MNISSKKFFGSVIFELLGIVAVAVILSAIVSPSFARVKANDQLGTCVSNVRAIGVACEMYAADHEGCFPDQLAYLTIGGQGPYLAEIPACPTAGMDTYSCAGYQVSDDRHDFTVSCHGCYHADAGQNANLPLYSSRQTDVQTVCVFQPVVEEIDRPESQTVVSMR